MLSESPPHKEESCADAKSARMGKGNVESGVLQASSEMHESTHSKGRAMKMPPMRQVSFSEDVEEHETYECYKNYFSEYDRRAIRRERLINKDDVDQIMQELQALRCELFPDGTCFGDRGICGDRCDGCDMREVQYEARYSVLHEAGLRSGDCTVEDGFCNQTYFHISKTETPPRLKSDKRGMRTPGKSLVKHYEYIRSQHSTTISLAYNCNESD